MFKPSSEIIVKATFDLSENSNFKNIKNIIAVNGEAVVSKQEKDIYEYLLQFEDLHITYEKTIQRERQNTIPRFYDTQQKNQPYICMGTSWDDQQ